MSKGLLLLLTDKNAEVQNLAIKCLAPAVTKLKPHLLEMMTEQMCRKFDFQSENTRDVGALALRTIVLELPNGVSQATNLCMKRIMPHLIERIASTDNQQDISIKLDLLDILSKVISRFGRFYAFKLEEVVYFLIF